MPRSTRDCSRRGFLASAMAAGALVPGLAAGQPRGPRPALAIDALGLDAETRADLETFARPVLREAAWLDELSLDGIGPAFVFLPDADE